MAGSPPPMRGKAKLQIIDKNSNGITPAYAGKSVYMDDSTLLHQDHPRLCGEKSLSLNS